MLDIYNSGEPKDELARAGAVSQWRMGDDPLDDATGGTGNVQDQVGTSHGIPYNMEASDCVLDVPV